LLITYYFKAVLEAQGFRPIFLINFPGVAQLAVLPQEEGNFYLDPGTAEMPFKNVESLYNDIIAH
jgi:hypothetical protein